MVSIVALDIETTGLDPHSDAILEIGAVRFNARRVEDEWSTLISPGRPIPPFITQLTGITDQMVREAPPIRAVLADLKDFVGDLPVLGHNVQFDLAFLRRYGILALNDVLDTYELASVLLPTAGRYNLGALAQALKVPLPATHRALDDARATRAVYQRLHEQAQHMPLNLLAELVQLGEQLDWGGYWALREALQERSKETISARRVKDTLRGPLFSSRSGRPPAPLQPAGEECGLDEDEVAALLEHGGVFSRYFPQFEFRPQ